MSAQGGPKFGQWFRNTSVSETNPIRDGMFVREIRREGRLNPGRVWHMTDGNGKFWDTNPAIVVAIPPRTPSPNYARLRAGVEGLASELREDSVRHRQRSLNGDVADSVAQAFLFAETKSIAERLRALLAPTTEEPR